DCNGLVDDGNPGGGAACNSGAHGVCAAGTFACAAGHLVCNQAGQPSAEACNGLDDDCDGAGDPPNCHAVSTTLLIAEGVGGQSGQLWSVDVNTHVVMPVGPVGFP